MEKAKKNKNAWREWIAMAFFVLIGMVCGFLIGRFIGLSFAGEEPLYLMLLSAILLFFGMYGAILFQLIVHEGGHLVFGLLSGYKFSSFRIFSLMWVKDGEKIKLKRLQLAGTSGQCLMAPPDLKDGRIPVVLYNLGGALMNVLFSLIFLGLYFVCGAVPFLSTMMLIFSAIGFILALMNGVPMRWGLVDNDGYNAFSIARNPAAMRAFWVQLKSNEEIAKGARLRALPEEWFAVPADEEMKNSMVAVIGVLACNRLMDAQRFEEADALMARMLETSGIGIVGLHRNLMICDRIYLELIGENRKEILEGLFTAEEKKFMKSMKNCPSVMRSELYFHQ